MQEPSTRKAGGDDKTSGTWSNGAAGGCTIDSGKSACSFSLSGLANRDDAISYTDADRGTVTITR